MISMKFYGVIDFEPSYLARSRAGFGGGFGMGYGGYSGRPEGGCSSYCSVLDDLSRDILTDDVTVQLQNQGYQGQALDAMVTSRVTTLHNQRVALNRKSWEQHEEPRTPENAVIYEARLDERDGKLHLYHPEAQQFVHDMFVNTARVAQRVEQEFGIRGLYNREEHKTFLQVEKDVLTGRAAAGMWAAYDASGTVRYVSQIENQGGTIIARWIDVGLIRGDLTPEEGVSLLQRIAGENHGSRLVTSDESALHLIMEQKSLSSDAVWKATNTVIDERPVTSFRYVDVRPVLADVEPLHHALIDVPRLEEIGKNEIVSEIHTRIHPGIAAMGTLKIAEVMHRKSRGERNTFHGFSLVELVDRYVTSGVVKAVDSFGKGEQSVDNNNAAAVLLSINQKSEEGALHPNVQPERLTIEKISEKPVRIVEIIEKRHEEMKKGMAMLGVIAETGVMIHAAPMILSRLKEKLPPPVVAMKKSIERHKKKELRKKKKDSVKVQPFKKPLRTERVEPFRTAKERKKRQKSGREKGTKRIAAASEIILSVSKKRERREKWLMRRAVEKSMRRHKKKELKRETKKDSVKVQPLKIARVEPFKERKQSIQRTEREAVVAIRFAWIVWMMVRVNYERKDKPKVSIRSHPALQGETLRRQEETLWVLLSIIYYLTAIREQAMHNHPVAQFIPVQQTIPQYAVIFAYAS